MTFMNAEFLLDPILGATGTLKGEISSICSFLEANAEGVVTLNEDLDI